MDDTSQAVLNFMIKTQEQQHRPPSLSEIAAAVPALNYRSSARNAVQTLIQDGKVIATGPQGTSRRYVALPGDPSPWSR